MRPIIFVVLFAAMLLVPAVSFAETNAECLARCTADKASRDEACPSAAYEGDPLRAQCLQESNEIFTVCTVACPQPESQTDMPPAEKTE